MKGVHRRDAEAHNLLNLKPGEYVYVPGQGWHACTPNGMLANLSAHDCTLDGDALTVEPSILVRGGSEEKEWHGYLEAGMWRAC